VGDCYPLNCLGHARAVAHYQREPKERSRWLWGTNYCQGWFIRRFRDGSGVDAFPHGFLVHEASDGATTVIDGLADAYGYVGDLFWLPVQRWSYMQVERWMEHPITHKAWPLTTRPGGLELDDRIGYKRALQYALMRLGAAHG